MNRLDDAGKLILRLSLGLLILLHGLAKLTGGIASILTMVHEQGLPSALAYGVYLGEIIAPALVILGVLTRPAAAMIAINMAIAIYLAHTSHIFSLTKAGGWTLELQGMFFFSALAIALLGAGHYSVGGSKGRLN